MAAGRAFGKNRVRGLFSSSTSPLVCALHWIVFANAVRKVRNTQSTLHFPNLALTENLSVKLLAKW